MAVGLGVTAYPESTDSAGSVVAHAALAGPQPRTEGGHTVQGWPSHMPSATVIGAGEECNPSQSVRRHLWTWTDLLRQVPVPPESLAGRLWAAIATGKSG